MVNAQKWLEQRYPTKEEREETKKIVIIKNNLEGHLDLRDFVYLEELICSNCNLTSLDLPDTIWLEVIDLSNNRLTNIDLSKNSRLRSVDLSLNRISANLNIFSHLTELRTLDLNFGIPKPKGNDFYGSLKALENCKQLKHLRIEKNKRIAEGLEYLPVEKLTRFDCHGTIFAKILKPYGYGSERLKKCRAELKPEILRKLQQSTIKISNLKTKKSTLENSLNQEKGKTSNLEATNRELEKNTKDLAGELNQERTYHEQTKSQLRDLTTILFPSSSDSDISNISFNAVKTQAKEIVKRVELGAKLGTWLESEEKELKKLLKQELTKKTNKINQLEKELTKLKIQLKQKQELEMKIKQV